MPQVFDPSLTNQAEDARKKEDALRKAQRVTEEAMRMACEMIGRAKPRADGVLMRFLYEGGSRDNLRFRAF